MNNNGPNSNHACSCVNIGSSNTRLRNRLVMIEIGVISRDVHVEGSLEKLSMEVSSLRTDLGLGLCFGLGVFGLKMFCSSNISCCFLC